MFNVAVIGAGGHVGLPFAIVNALAGNKVIGVDINEEFVLKLNDGKYPYVEEGGDEGLEHVLKSKKLYFTTSQILPKHIDVIAIMIGTPVDSENNPRLDYLMNYVDDHLIPHLSSLPNDSYGEPGPLIVLRSTVAPGTTELLQKKLDGYRCQLVFCPERVVQGKSLIETSALPQIVGAFSQWDFETASKYFGTFNNSETIYLSPREAEVAKLITNMTRYVNFALANEFYMIGDQQGIDIHRVIDAANKDYPRLDLPKPGPNVGGPCLFKDGRFLLKSVPFVDLIQTAFVINEGMPQYVFNRMMEANPNIKSVRIYGMTFKANNDDIRNSLSFKFKKICEQNGLIVEYTDPYYGVKTSGDIDHKKDVDALVIMTPHDEYKGLFDNKWNPPKEGQVLVDVWKIGGKLTKGSHNGIAVVKNR